MKELNEKNAITKEDVTQEMVDRCFSKVKGYEKSIKKVIKEGKEYVITFNEGYTAFLSNVRKARTIGEVVWLSRIATDEKANGYDLKHYIEEFKQNNIAFDGKTIPEYIDTIEQVEKRKAKEEAQKAKETKTETTSK